NSLVRLLTAKERDKARSVFQGLVMDKDVMITRAECRQAQQSWFHKLKDPQSCNVSLKAQTFKKTKQSLVTCINHMYVNIMILIHILSVMVYRLCSITNLPH
ncbi:hypothetical protein XENORESO_011052, partial [Xenotaenia resolanae]